MGGLKPPQPLPLRGPCLLSLSLLHSRPLKGMLLKALKSCLLGGEEAIILFYTKQDLLAKSFSLPTLSKVEYLSLAL